MAQADVLNDYTPVLPYGSPQRIKPSITTIKAAISGSGVAASYPASVLNAATENDLVYICRVHNISVAGL